jgi:hypothetical protein
VNRSHSDPPLLLLLPPLLFTRTVPSVSSSIVPALKLPDLTEGGEDRDFHLPAITGSFGEILQVLQVNQNFYKRRSNNRPQNAA